MSKLYNINIERAILSSILFDGEIFEDVKIKITAYTFYLPFHQYIFGAYESLAQKNLPIDEIFLTKELGDKMNEVQFIEIMSANAISNLNAYVDDLKELQRKRELNQISLKIKQEIEEKSSEEIITTIAKSIELIDKDSDDFIDIESIMNEFEQDVASAGKEDLGKVLPTGIKELDAIIGGVEEGEVVIIGARPSMGKTSAVTTMIANWVEDPSCGILFDSLEMKKKQIVRRIVSTLSDTTLYDLKKGFIKDFSKYKRSIKIIKESGLIIHDKNGVNFNYIKSKAQRVLRKNKNIKVWIIDHIGEISYKDPRFLRIEMGEVMSGVRAIAKEFGISVIILSQLNREVTNRKSNRPTLADLRESGELEQKADKVILLHRESYYQRGEKVREPDVTEAEMIVAKNRDGATGISKVNFEGKYTRFTNNSVKITFYDENNPMREL